MDFVGWLTDPANWSGSEGIPARVLQHVELSLFSLGLAALVAVPIGLLIGHTKRAEFLAVTTANLGRAIPSFAILSVTFQVVLVYQPDWAFGRIPTIVALFFLGIPPLLTNTYVGVAQVDANTVEAARGMGMTGRQVLARLEIPLATPLAMAGARTAAVQIVATATLAALIGGGGLGRFIVDGFARQRFDMMVGGAVLVGVLALLTEVGFAGLARATAPRRASA